MPFDATIFPLAAAALSMLAGVVLSWDSASAWQLQAQKAPSGSPAESEAKTHQLVAAISAAVCLTATIAYAYMIRTRKTLSDPDEIRNATRDTRHVDWLITLPLLAAELRLYVILPSRFDGQQHVASLLLAMLFAGLTVYCGHNLPPLGLYSGVGTQTRRTYARWFAAGCVSMFACFWCMLLWPVGSATVQNVANDRSNNTAAIGFASLWIIYPALQYALDTNRFDSNKNWDEISFALLDVAAKVGPALYGSLYATAH